MLLGGTGLFTDPSMLVCDDIVSITGNQMLILA